MSTVRMAKKLVDEILRSFKKSYDKANPKLEIDTKYGDQLYNTYIGPRVATVVEAAEEAFGDLFDAKSMFGKSNQLSVQAPVTISQVTRDDTGTDSVTAELHEEHYFTIELSTERLVPKVINKSSWSSIAEDVRYAFDRYEDKTFNYVCEVHEHNSKLQANKELSAREVRILLGKFTTLNQALKAWPALSKLVAPEKLAKVHEKQQRKRKQDLQKEMADEVIVGSDINKTIIAGALLGDADQ